MPTYSVSFPVSAVLTDDARRALQTPSPCVSSYRIVKDKYELTCVSDLGIQGVLDWMLREQARANLADLFDVQTQDERGEPVTIPIDWRTTQKFRRFLYDTREFACEANWGKSGFGLFSEELLAYGRG